MCRTCLLLRADFFAFRFVSDLRPRQYIESIEQIFSDRSSETKWPLGSKRNALPKRAGKPPDGSRRNLRDTGGEKTVGRSGMASGKKNLRATWRAPVLPPFRRSGGCRPMSPCPETPCPFCGSGPADRGVDQGVRFYRSRPVRRRHHRYCRGRTVCRRRGRRAWMLCPASGCPVSRMSSAPGDKSLAEHAGRDGDLLRPGPGESRDPGFHPDRCRDAGG